MITAIRSMRAIDVTRAGRRSRRRGPDPDGGHDAGRRAASARYVTAEDCCTGVARIVSEAEADLEELVATQSGELERLQAVALRAEREARSSGEGATLALASAGSQAPLDHERRRSQVLLVAVLVLLALLGGVVNMTVFQILGLGSLQTAAVVLGVELLVTLAAHQLGVRLAQWHRPSIHAAVVVVTAAALVASIAFLSIVRGAVFQADNYGLGSGAPVIGGGAAVGLFASLTALLIAVAVDIGFASHTTSVGRPSRSTTRRSPPPLRAVPRGLRLARRQERNSVDAHAAVAATRELHAHRLESRRALWHSEIAAYFQGFRAGAPCEVLPDLDAIRLPRVELPSVGTNTDRAAS